MMHPLLHLIATRPQMLADHAEAYAELVASEVADVSASWKRRVVLNAVALCCLGVAAVLAGVALMLWAVFPPASMHAPWALLVAPLVPLAIALICLWMARPAGDVGPFDKVRQQLQADMLMFREVSPS